MKFLTNWFEKLKDPATDHYERRYRLFSLLSMVMMIAWVFILSLVDFKPMRIILLGGVIFLCLLALVLALRTGKYQRSAGWTAALYTFLLMPLIFFYDGGIPAGTFDYAVISLVFILMTLNGRLRIVMSFAAVAELLFCIGIALLFPQTVRTVDTTPALVDAVTSVIFTLIFTGTAILFQLYMFRQERAILEAQRAQIEDLNRAQNRFFSSMSHEIRTPINTIIGMNELMLRDNTLSEESASRANAITAASGMLLSLINDILDMSKIESGKLDIIPVEYDTGALFSEVAQMIEERAAEKGLTFRVNVDEAFPSRLYGDEVRIKQILINLLNNAVKYTETGSVTLSAQGGLLDDNTMRLSFRVEDTGIGIKKDAIPYLFDAFKRVDEQKNRNIEGTGLGLSIVKQITDLMGGEISVSSIYTKGSVFTVSLTQPVIDASPVGDLSLFARRRKKDDVLYKHSFEAPDARILIVDDNEMNLTVEASLLADTRIQIDTARSGEEALRKTPVVHYDVIFMDHLMPGMDGIACLKQIRSQAGGLNRETPVIALTANAGAENKALYASSGFDAYLLKPVVGHQLEEALLKTLPESKISLTGATTMQSDTETVFSQTGKKKRIRITTDSAADLPPYLAAHADLGIIHFLIETDAGRFFDLEELTHEEILSYMETQNRHAKSIVPSVEEYERFFGEQVTLASHVIHIALSKSVSKSIDNAVAAAKAFDNVTVYESGTLSGGTGILALYAAHIAESAKEAGDVLRLLDLVRPQIKTSFVMESAETLSKNGYLSPARSALMDAFLMHPVIVMKNGGMRAHVAVSNTYRKRYIKKALTRFKNIDTSLLFIVYAGIAARELEEIRAFIDTVQPFDRVVTVKTSCTNAVNCGPDTFGLSFRVLGEDRALNGPLFDFLPEPAKVAEAPVTTEETAPLRDTDLYDLSEMDLEEGIRNCGSKEIFDRAVQTFAASADSKAKELEDYLSEEDWENFMIKIHALKSSARLIGAMRLSKQAEELEALCNITMENAGI